MFFFKKKKLASKNKLPDKLVALKYAPQPSWVWDVEYRVIIWSNIEGLKFWKVNSRDEIKELIFPENNAMVMACDKQNKKVQSGKFVCENITFPTRPTATNYVCHLEAQELPDGRSGILITLETPQIQQNDQSSINKNTSKTHKAEANKTNIIREEDNSLLDADTDIDADFLKRALLKSHNLRKSFEKKPPVIDDFDNKHYYKDTKTVDDYDKSIHEIDDDKTNYNQYNDVSSDFKMHETDASFGLALTLTCNHLGLITSINDFGQKKIKLKEGDKFLSLFVKPDKGFTIFQNIQKNTKFSFVEKINLGHGEYPYLIQSTQYNLEGKKNFNIGILQVSEEKYQDFIFESQNHSDSQEDHDQDIDFLNELLKDDSEHTLEHEHDSDISFSDDAFNEQYSVDISLSDTEKMEHYRKNNTSNEDEKYFASSLVGDMTGVGIFNVKKDGVIKSANDVACALVGYDNDVLIGKNIIDLLGTEAQPVLHELIRNKNSAVLDDLEKGVRVQYSDARYVEHIAKLVVKPNKTSDGFWFVLNDSTEIEKIKQELVEFEKIKTELAELRQFKADNLPAIQKVNHLNVSEIPHFVNAVSHEIRAPLNAISGYAEMIENEVFGKMSDIRYKEYANSIRGAGEYALSIINELLDYSKLKAGGFTPQFAPVDINQVVIESFDIVYPHANSKKIELIKTVLTGTPMLHSDARLLKQVLINLLTNAIKYSSEGDQVILTAGLTKTGRFMIEITDFGRGMTKQEIHEALTPFSRGAAQNDVPGTGLGLSLSKELCELIHARFMIDSVPNEKTRVRIIYEKESVL